MSISSETWQTIDKRNELNVALGFTQSYYYTVQGPIGKKFRFFLLYLHNGEWFKYIFLTLFSKEKN
jgi:hypothetical protein